MFRIHRSIGRLPLRLHLLLCTSIALAAWEQSCFGQFADDLANGNLLSERNVMEPHIYSAGSSRDGGPAGAPIEVPLYESPVNASFLGRAAAVSDSTRLATFAGSGFLPSAIPV